jgi:hypothetical protein
VPFPASDGVGGFSRGSLWIRSGSSGYTLLPNTYFFLEWNLGPHACLDPWPIWIGPESPWSPAYPNED